MDKPSPFQAQYPLSKRKIVKKMLALILGFGILFVFLGGMLILPWLSDPENGQAVTVFLLAAAIPLIFIALIVVGLHYVYYLSYIRRYYYDCGEDFITIQKGVFGPREIHVQYQKIQDVYVDQDIWDRMLGIYDVHIASATSASGMAAHIDGVDGPVAEALKNLILGKIKGSSMGGGGAVSVAAGIPQAPAPRIAPAQLSEPVNQVTYPIETSWRLVSMLQSFFSALVTIAFLSFYFSVKADANISLGEMFRYWLPSVIVLSVVYVVFRLVWLSIWMKKYKFEFLPEFIFLSSGVISREERHLPYTVIQDVAISQGVIARMFGLADVKIENAAQMMVGSGRGATVANGGIVIPGQTLARAQKLVEVVRSITNKQGASQSGL